MRLAGPGGHLAVREVCFLSGSSKNQWRTLDGGLMCFRNHSDSSKEACLARVRVETCCLSEKATCTEVIEEGPAEGTRLLLQCAIIHKGKCH